MSELNPSTTQNEWLGVKSALLPRTVITIITVSIVVALFIYAAVHYVVGIDSPFGGLLFGIFSGLLTSGMLAGISWFAYDYFLPMQRHKDFSPKVEGKWFGYYPQTHNGDPITEFVYVKQVARKVSGTIIDPNGEIYEFVGQLAPGTLSVSWFTEEGDRNRTGSIILAPTDDHIWQGLQVYGHPSSRIACVEYIISRRPISVELLRQRFAPRYENSEAKNETNNGTGQQPAAEH
ncbi:MAG: hypothetical protein ACOYNY_13990 [Caldilineaceae bacterium]